MILLFILGLIIGFTCGYLIGIKKHTQTQKGGNNSKQVQIH